MFVPQVPNSSSARHVSSCQGLDRSNAKYGGGGSRNRMHSSDYEYESASLLYGHADGRPPPPPPDDDDDDKRQQRPSNSCCSEGNTVDRCVQSALPGLGYKHRSGEF